jgi:hypothetical protein
MRIQIATREHRLPTIATAINLTCQLPNVAMESSKFSPTSLSNMKTDDVKKSYNPKPTRVDHGSEEFVNSVQFHGSCQNLIIYGQSLKFCLDVSI